MMLFVFAAPHINCARSQNIVILAQYFNGGPIGEFRTLFAMEVLTIFQGSFKVPNRSWDIWNLRGFDINTYIYYIGIQIMVVGYRKLG